MAKRANDMGSVYRNRERKRWEAKYWVVDDDGKRRRRLLTARTRAEVENRLREAMDALDQGLAVPDKAATVATWAEFWKTEVLPHEGLAPSTVAWYHDLLDRCVVPRVGAKTLTGPKALTVADVDALTAALSDQCPTPRTANAARTVLSKMLRAAEVRGLASRNVARLAKPVGNSGRARKVKALTDREVESLLDGLRLEAAAEKRNMAEAERAAKRKGHLGKNRSTPVSAGDLDPVWPVITLVGLRTGLRPGELLGLSWAAVHLAENPHISVRQALRWYKDSLAELKAPKRERSYRTVPLDTVAVAALEAWSDIQATCRFAAGTAWSDDHWLETRKGRRLWRDSTVTGEPGTKAFAANLVFTGTNGAPKRLDVWRNALSDALPGTHPHRLRHTYATYLLEKGAPTSHVAELLGDAEATVEAHYSHVLRPKSEAAALVSTMPGGQHSQPNTLPET